MIVDGYGDAGEPSVVQMLPVERYELAVSLIVRTASKGNPILLPDKMRLIVSLGSVKLSPQIVMFTVFTVSPGLKVTG